MNEAFTHTHARLHSCTCTLAHARPDNNTSTSQRASTLKQPTVKKGHITSRSPQTLATLSYTCQHRADAPNTSNARYAVSFPTHRPPPQLEQTPPPVAIAAHHVPHVRPPLSLAASASPAALALERASQHMLTSCHHGTGGQLLNGQQRRVVGTQQ